MMMGTPMRTASNTSFVRWLTVLMVAAAGTPGCLPNGEQGSGGGGKLPGG